MTRRQATWTSPRPPDEVSFWLADAGVGPPRPALAGATDADVAILGAGFSGLWTAWYLLEQDPTLRIVICEAQVAGFGASGRNGAWCAAGLGVTPAELIRRYGRAVAARTLRALRDTVDEVGRASDAAGVDAGWRKVGVLRIARGPHEQPGVDAAWRSRAALGLTDGCAVLSAGALAERVRVAGAVGAFFEEHGAVVHPGRLVRGLADAVEARGARLHERTPVLEVHPAKGRRRPVFVTPGGDVRADVVVLAGEAYLSQLRGLRRRLLPVYSLIVLTEPLPAERLAAIGWQGRELLSSHRLTVDYLSRTADDRIVFGGRGAPYHFGSAIRHEYDRHEATHAGLRSALVEWFPALEGVRFTHAWGGPLGMPRDFLPTVTTNRSTGVAAAFGYTGQGVATTNLAGRILAAQISGAPVPDADLPLVGHRPRRWEPEPLRFLGARLVQAGLRRVDRRARRTGAPPSGRSIPERLLRH